MSRKFSIVFPDCSTCSRGDPRLIAVTNRLAPTRSRPFLSHTRSLPPGWWWLVASLISLLMGCPASSDWDREWEHMQKALSQGHRQEAKALLHRLLPKVREQGATDSRYALVIFQLGKISHMEGQERQAAAYYWESLPLFAESVGPENPLMAEPLAALASLYHQQHQHDQAIPLLKRALAIREKSWGLSNSQLLPTLQAYHSLLLSADHPQEAREITSRIARIMEQSP